MVELYYYDYPQPFHSTAPLQPDQSMTYWFGYPNQGFLEVLRQEALKQEKKDKEKAKEEEEKKKAEKKKEEDKKKEEEKKKEEDKKKEEKQDDKKPQLIEMKVPLCCESCARKVMRRLENMKGVEKPVICDMYDMKVSVTAIAKPEDVLKTVKRVKKDAEMWPKKK